VIDIKDKILVLDVGLGNVGSICNMLSYIGIENYRSSSPKDIMNAKKMILPGVGAFDAGMNSLNLAGLTDVIKSAVENNNLHILGICLGMHLLFDSSEEGVERGLKLIPGKVRKFLPEDKSVKVPHMGWNTVRGVGTNSALIDTTKEERYYFVHSYYVDCENENNVAAISNHEINFHSIVVKGNVYGVQFHPEKSHRFGMELFKRFSEL
jgi:imidazole glycerol-phosphate synthase subunit HisH